MRVTLDTDERGNVTASLPNRYVKMIEVDEISQSDADFVGPGEYHRTLRIVTSCGEVLELWLEAGDRHKDALIVKEVEEFSPVEKHKDNSLDWLSPTHRKEKV